MMSESHGYKEENGIWTHERYRMAMTEHESEIEELRRHAAGEDVRHALIRQLGYLGRCRRLLGDLEGAIAALGEAMELGASVELCPVCTHLAFIEIGTATRETGDLATSEAVLRRLVDELEAHEAPHAELLPVARVELGTTITRTGEGRQDLAASALAPAIGMLEALDAAKPTSHTKRNLAAARAQFASALNKCGDHGTAIWLLRQASATFAELDEVRMFANTKIALADALANTGSREAFRHFEEVIPLFHEFERMDQDDHGTAHHNFAVSLIMLGDQAPDIERAGEELEAALRVRRAIGAHEDVAESCQWLALLLPSEEESQRLLDEAKTIRARLADQVGLAEALQFEGRNRRLLGLDQEARASYLGAIGCVEAARARLDTAAGRATLLAVHRELYAQCALLHLDLGLGHEAFQFSEAARGRSLLDVRAAEFPGLDVDSAFREERHRLAQEMTERSMRLRELGRQALDAGAASSGEAEGPSRDLMERIEKLEGELLEREGRWDELEARAVAESPRFAARAATGVESIWPVHRIQNELLDEDQVLLEYLISGDDCLLFCLTSSGFRIVQMEGLWPEIAEMVEALGSALESTAESYPFGYELYRVLIEPIEDMLEGKRELLISADDELHRLPFAALLRLPEPAAGEQGSGRWSRLPFLLGDFDIRYVASATSQGLLRAAERSEVLEVDRDLLALAASLEGGEVGGELAPLPNVRLELDRISEHFDQRRVRRVPGSVAPQPVPKAAALALMTEGDASYRFVHLATHAIADDRRPWQAAIVFDDGGVDDYLTARELLDLRLPAHNVTLSGCQTAGTQMVAGEGIVGLALALRHAGARCVCASWWPVFDSTTMELMDAFYGALADEQGDSTGVAAALCRAQRSLIAADYHPRHWAAFAAFG